MEKKILKFQSKEALFEYLVVTNIVLYELDIHEPILMAELNEAQMELAINGYTAVITDKAEHSRSGTVEG